LIQDVKLIGRLTPEAAQKICRLTHTSRALLACGVAAALSCLVANDAQASGQRKASAKRGEEAKKEAPAPKGPLTVAISIANQHLTVYDGGVPIAHAPVSTGMAGHPTPMGVFSVIQKQRWHQSNIYSGAPMPFMQRITWSGVAMHAGVLPGYPASHGCIRMPHEFAVRLYGMTKMGVRVFVTRNDVKPVEFADSHLFTPKPPQEAQSPQPIGERVASADPMVPVPQSPAVIADAAKNRASEGAAAAEGAAKNENRIENTENKFENKDPSQSADAKAAQGSGGVSNSAPVGPPVAEATANEAVSPGAPTATEPKSVEDHAATAPTLAPVEKPQAADANSVTAQGDNAATTAESTPADVPIPLARPQLAPIKPGPISIFISKKLSKLFVRKNFETVLDSPVTIVNPERTLGTHVFTATGYTDDHTAMRWQLVSLPSDAKREERRAELSHGSQKRHEQGAKIVTDASPPETAAEALDRIDVPQETRERIAELLTPGSSVVITDKDLGPETGESGETDFIVLTR
jgi:L,D-transpeptidase catalytic domain